MPRPRWPRRLRRRGPAALLVAALLGALAGCGSGPAGPPVLTWYINPDSGGQEEIAARCTAAAGGQYSIAISTLPRESSEQRQQLVRRLAANDSSIDIMSLDPPYIPELAQAGFLAPVPQDVAAKAVDGVAQSAIEGATWNGRAGHRAVLGQHPAALVQEVRRRRGRAGHEQAGHLGPARPGGEGAEHPDRGPGPPGRVPRRVVQRPDRVRGRLGDHADRRQAAGHQARPRLRRVDPCGRGDARGGRQRCRRAGLHHRGRGRELSRPSSRATRASWSTGRSCGAAPRAPSRAARSTAPSLDDYGWALFPQVDAGKPSAPPLGGINIGVGAFSLHPDLAYEATECITSNENQAYYFVSNGNPASRLAVFSTTRR